MQGVQFYHSPWLNPLYSDPRNLTLILSSIFLPSPSPIKHSNVTIKWVKKFFFFECVHFNSFKLNKINLEHWILSIKPARLDEITWENMIEVRVNGYGYEVTFLFPSSSPFSLSFSSNTHPSPLQHFFPPSPCSYLVPPSHYIPSLITSLSQTPPFSPSPSLFHPNNLSIIMLFCLFS